MKRLPLFTLSLLASLTTMSALAESASYQRAATGDITQHGGARRLSGDQTEALKASLSNSTAKNVILLIGDGMGDSEITAARNQAMGPAVSFPVLMRCRSPASTPITHWTRKRISQTT